jgi:mannose-6-phosphate isomerase-like protein (cupin superfamily)
MLGWWKSVLGGPIPASLAVCAVFVALATWLAPRSDGEASGNARIYDTAGALQVEPGASAAKATVGAYPSATVVHLRLESGVATHLHRRHDETVTILSGRGRLRLGDETRDVGPGTVVLIPRGTPHSVEVTEGPMEAISVFSPAFDGKDRLFVDE